MNHETLKALYQLDVQEVGEKEAVKRWEYQDAMHNWFLPCLMSPSWGEWIYYRRKPGIPWPTAMQSDFVTQLAKRVVELEKQLSTQWPDDAPEWANWMATDELGQTYMYEAKPIIKTNYWAAVDGRVTGYKLSHTNWRDTLIERPKPAKQKIDWGKLPKMVFWACHIDNSEHGLQLPSNWVAWNCDDHTRGNPLPDGLVVEWYYHEYDCEPRYLETINWNLVTRFRIVGIQEGWE